ncbi:metal-dependent amidase/aminoacylase/carboxypeptidase [Delitschia confertaspora ATCC 74209]|uniref:Metal-dependent amidase/aminoacylase/carboxypeptidase n=1 Tax=Delitschia confertaspora ATCC 74209 TaxID=1513339 RepID=A0A9P4JCX7_9PLEO|nr:metal-dependent amidase/aminoacylase/carboxypeptidase [Delitschia confertaspora ATCC 74209]
MATITEIITKYRPNLGPYEELYKYYHTHPELSFQESSTASSICSHLSSLNLNFSIFPHIGGHGVAAVLENGPGRTILLRADIDALPVEEKSGLDYASTRRMRDLEGVEKPVMHACGHDVHITALLAAAECLGKCKGEWSGTLVLVFQPAEEKGAGAQAMVDDGLYEKVPEPDLCVGGHVMPYRAGMIGTKHGLVASSADSFRLTIHGRGAHASTPHVSIDPIIQASSTILRLQAIVAREISPLDFAVVTVSAIHAGDAENVIPDRAEVKLNVRAALPETREKVLDSMKRIIDAEATASNAPSMPDLQPTTQFPFLFNDASVTSALEKTFAAHFPPAPHGYNPDIPRLPGSEDFGILATSIGKPSCFFLYGGVDPEVWDKAEREGKLSELPGNHSPYFVPVIGECLGVAVDGYVVAALTFLGKGA